MLMYYGSRPICNEHLEEQRDDLSYITARVGTVSAARGEKKNPGVHVFSTQRKKFPSGFIPFNYFI